MTHLYAAGETVVYNQNILHCATYSPDSTRVTLHACIGNAKNGAGQTRARNILQHGVGWMKEDERFEKEVRGCGDVAVRMWENTVMLGAGKEGEAVEYSQD